MRTAAEMFEIWKKTNQERAEKSAQIEGERIKREVERQLNNLYARIEKKTNEGENSFQHFVDDEYFDELFPQTIERLKELGCKIEKDFDEEKQEDFYLISWGK